MSGTGDATGSASRAAQVPARAQGLLFTEDLPVLDELADALESAFQDAEHQADQTMARAGEYVRQSSTATPPSG